MTIIKKTRTRLFGLVLLIFLITFGYALIGTPVQGEENSHAYPDLNLDSPAEPISNLHTEQTITLENPGLHEENPEQNESEALEFSAEFKPRQISNSRGIVAKIGDTVYASLEAAVNAAVDGVETTITLVANVYLAKPLIIPGNKIINLTDDGQKRKIWPGGQVAPVFKLESESNLTISGTRNENLVTGNDNLFRHSSKASVVLVGAKATFNLRSATIFCGGIFEPKSSEAGTGAVYLENGSTFNMSGGIIQGLYSNSWYTSPVFVRGGATFNMSGGEIKDNQNTYNSYNSGGGGVLLFSWNEKDPIAKMTMSGGIISNNQAMNGGGVYLTGNTSFVMTGGKITGNKASPVSKGGGHGGGVCVSAKSANHLPETAEFIMRGGEISHNTATSGGGIYIHSNKVSLEAGRIEYNEAAASRYRPMSGHGGGVYISQDPITLQISKTVISQNKAVPGSSTPGLGGGLWCCPTGNIDLQTSSGIAIFDNQASGENTAGNDFVKVASSDLFGQTNHVTIPNRMLGGGKVDWLRDGDLRSDHISDIGVIDSSVPRYSAASPDLIPEIHKSKQNVAALARVSESAKQRAFEEATLFIMHNTANHGGGIGTNGNVQIIDFAEDSNWRLDVEKLWSESTTPDQKKEVEIFLKINGLILDSIRLNPSNNWKGSFLDLPDPRTISGQKFEVVEGSLVSGKFRPTDIYDVEYGQMIISEELRTCSISVTNQPTNS